MNLLTDTVSVDTFPVSGKVSHIACAITPVADLA